MLVLPRSSVQRPRTVPVENVHGRNRAGDALRSSPNLNGQLTAALNRPIDSIFCSALDTSAATCVQSATAARFPYEVVAGAAMLARMLEVPSARYSNQYSVEMPTGLTVPERCALVAVTWLGGLRTRSGFTSNPKTWTLSVTSGP